MEAAKGHHCVTVVFEGRVQGVGFRFTAAELAARRPVSGYVRNEWDGSVKIVAEGAKSELEGFIRDIYRSHVGSGIRNEHRDWDEATGAFDGFGIRYG